MMKSKQGFTLIELLVVIAIVAILSVVVILTLNPAELLKQSRDSNRVSDGATLKSSLALYLADGGTALATSSLYGTCYMTAASTISPGPCNVFFTTGLAVSSTNAARTIAGSGWVPVNFSAISSGAPFSMLPIDPVNNASYYYAYAATSTNLVWKIYMLNMESGKYRASGTSDVVSTDGGTQNSSFEVGTASALVL